MSPTRALLGVSLAVLLAGSTWFSGTAALPTLRGAWGLSDAQGAWLTIAVQAGFITGTFLYAVLNVADVFNARRVFLVSAVLGAAFNAGFAWLSAGLPAAIVFRFLTGVTLAGVYPVGMKIVASWFRTGLGWRLGVLVGALVLGTASPYLVQAVGAGADWRLLATTGSVLALVGGTLVAATGDRRPVPHEPGSLRRPRRRARLQEPRLPLHRLRLFRPHVGAVRAVVAGGLLPAGPLHRRRRRLVRAHPAHRLRDGGRGRRGLRGRRLALARGWGSGRWRSSPSW